jgi:hypothetical protein
MTQYRWAALGVCVAAGVVFATVSVGAALEGGSRGALRAPASVAAYGQVEIVPYDGGGSAAVLVAPRLGADRPVEVFLVRVNQAMRFRFVAHTAYAFVRYERGWLAVDNDVFSTRMADSAGRDPSVHPMLQLTRLSSDSLRDIGVLASIASMRVSFRESGRLVAMDSLPGCGSGGGCAGGGPGSGTCSASCGDGSSCSTDSDCSSGSYACCNCSTSNCPGSFASCECIPEIAPAPMHAQGEGR